MPEDHFPDFSGKHVNIWLLHRHATSYLMKDAKFELQAGRLFLVGRVSDAYDEEVFGLGKVVCVAWDYVQHYMLFDSAEEWRIEAHASMRRREKQHEDAQKRRAGLK